MEANHKETIYERLSALFLWIDESFVCNIFKPDLCLGWFGTYANQACNTELELVYETIDNTTGSEETKNDIKQGYRGLITFLREYKNIVPKNYDVLPEKEKWQINKQIAMKLIEATDLLFKHHNGRSIEDEITLRMRMHEKWEELGLEIG